MQVFSGAGLAIFTPSQIDPFALCGLLNTRIVEHTLRALSDGRKWETAYARNAPVLLPELIVTRLGALAQRAIDCCIECLSLDETTRFFRVPFRPLQAKEIYVKKLMEYRECLREIDSVACKIFAVDEQAEALISQIVGDVTQWVMREDLLGSGISWDWKWRTYLLGLAFGRWDESSVYQTYNSSDTRSRALPKIEMNQLQTSRIFVDDVGHPDDIVGEVCTLSEELGTPFDRDDAREFFRRHAFEAHISQYSKSRRKAPIYWQFSTESLSYSVWVFVHALTPDSLFRIQNEFVTPKLLREQQHLNAMRIEVGVRQTRDQGELIERQEALVGELQALREEFARVSPIWSPSLEDGVEIITAPLWRLFSGTRSWQKECKAAWEALCGGDYDWAHLAMRIWPERVVPKCASDLSIAIAHGLEDVFWERDRLEKWVPRKAPLKSVDAIVKERSSLAVRDALKRLLEAAAPIESGKRRRMSKQP
jgi:hypothetical protein